MIKAHAQTDTNKCQKKSVSVFFFHSQFFSHYLMLCNQINRHRNYAVFSYNCLVSFSTSFFLVRRVQLWFVISGEVTETWSTCSSWGITGQVDKSLPIVGFMAMDSLNGGWQQHLPSIAFLSFCRNKHHSFFCRICFVYLFFLVVKTTWPDGIQTTCEGQQYRRVIFYVQYDRRTNTWVGGTRLKIRRFAYQYSSVGVYFICKVRIASVVSLFDICRIYVVLNVICGMHLCDVLSGWMPISRHPMISRALSYSTVVLAEFLTGLFVSSTSHKRTHTGKHSLSLLFLPIQSVAKKTARKTRLSLTFPTNPLLPPHNHDTGTVSPIVTE